MAILQLVDQMTDLLNEGREVPLSRYRMVDAEEFSQMLERMRISVPSSIRESERTLIERDNILAGARAEADKIIQEARDIASEMLGENSLVVMARKEAHRIIEDGHEVARQRTGEADGYATQVLQELHEKLESISGQVENGIAMMTQQGDQYDPSQYDSSQYDSSQYESPQYESPQYDPSQYNSSEYGAPEYGTSEYSASGFQATDMQPPQRRSTTPLTGRASREQTALGNWSQEGSFSTRASRVEGFEDRAQGTPQFERSEFSTESSDDVGFGNVGSNNRENEESLDDGRLSDQGFNAGGFDNSRFDNNEFDDYVAPREQGSSLADDSPLQAPMLNYLSDPSDPMSDHL